MKLLAVIAANNKGTLSRRQNLNSLLRIGASEGGAPRREKVARLKQVSSARRIGWLWRADEVALARRTVSLDHFFQIPGNPPVFR